MSVATNGLYCHVCTGQPTQNGVQSGGDQPRHCDEVSSARHAADIEPAHESIETCGLARHLQGVWSVAAQHGAVQSRYLGVEGSADLSACPDSRDGRLLRLPFRCGHGSEAELCQHLRCFGGQSSQESHLCLGPLSVRGAPQITQRRGGCRLRA